MTLVEIREQQRRSRNNPAKGFVDVGLMFWPVFYLLMGFQIPPIPLRIPTTLYYFSLGMFQERDWFSKRVELATSY